MRLASPSRFGMPMVSKICTKRVALFGAVIGVIFFAFWFLFCFYPDIHGSQTIDLVAEHAKLGTSNQTLIVERICDWESNHLNKGVFVDLLRPFMRVRPDANWIATTSVGNCGEFAVLFQAIATKAGVDSRIVYDISDDHMWNEFFDPVGNRWIHVDSTLSPPQNINDPWVYTRDWGKRLSFVFYLDHDSPIDITSNYTNTSNMGNLTIRIKNPSNGTSLSIYSWSLIDSKIENRDIYDIPIMANATILLNMDGEGSIRLGSNNYTIVAKTGFVYGMRAEEKIYVQAGNDSVVQLKLAPSFHQEDIISLVRTSQIVALLILALFGPMFLFYVIDYFKCKNKRIFGKGGKTNGN